MEKNIAIAEFTKFQVINSMRSFPERVMLFSHHDCGAYGGFVHFGNDPAKELEFHRGEHRKAVAAIKKRFPRLKVETYFIDPDGIIETTS